METIFLKLLNMSISAGWLILAVILLRFLLKKARKSVRMVLWAMVSIRLICPFSLESVLSLIPSAETVPQTIPYARQPAITSGIDWVDRAVNPVIAQNLTPISYAEAPPMLTITQVAGVVWAVGVGLMLLYVLVSWLQVRRKVTVAIEEEPGIFICDHIHTPFILGLFRPKIYLPSALAQAHVFYVTAHERAHIRRRDHWWKPLSFLLLAVYWFNPLIWVAYVLLCRDIELACDERVIRAFSPESKKNYSQALLACSLGPKAAFLSPLAFGEVGVKARIKAVLQYQMPAVWVTTVAALACVLAAVWFLTDPKAGTDTPEVQESIDRPAKKMYSISLSTFGELPNTPLDTLPLLSFSSSGNSRYTVNHNAYSMVENAPKNVLDPCHFSWSLDLGALHPMGRTEDGSILYASTNSSTVLLLAEQGNADNLIWLVEDGSTLLDIPNMTPSDFYAFKDGKPLDDQAELELLWSFHTDPAYSTGLLSLDGLWRDHTLGLVCKDFPALQYIIKYNVSRTALPTRSIKIGNIFHGYREIDIDYAQSQLLMDDHPALPSRIPIETESLYVGKFAPYTTEQLPVLELSTNFSRYTINGSLYNVVYLPISRELYSTTSGWSLDLSSMEAIGITASGFTVFGTEDDSFVLLLPEQGTLDGLIWLIPDGSTLLDLETLQLSDYHIYLDGQLTEINDAIEQLWEHHTSSRYGLMLYSEYNTFTDIHPAYTYANAEAWESHTITLVHKISPALGYILRYQIDVGGNCLRIANSSAQECYDILSLSPDELTQIGWSGISTTED